MPAQPQGRSEPQLVTHAFTFEGSAYEIKTRLSEVKFYALAEEDVTTGLCKPYPIPSEHVFFFPEFRTTASTLLRRKKTWISEVAKAARLREGMFEQFNARFGQSTGIRLGAGLMNWLRVLSEALNITQSEPFIESIIATINQIGVNPRDFGSAVCQFADNSYDMTDDEYEALVKEVKVADLTVSLLKDFKRVIVSTTILVCRREVVDFLDRCVFLIEIVPDISTETAVNGCFERLRKQGDFYPTSIGFLSLLDMIICSFRGLQNAIQDSAKDAGFLSGRMVLPKSREEIRKHYQTPLLWNASDSVRP
ncbi:hypothetical protein BDW74DRAFT_176267 [Aspergillus multicolor]|uniref:uncharacterized protein n=1 Tax=Aspergillus multicolor TaxID=41759 RepID=UPI003CCCAB7B